MTFSWQIFLWDDRPLLSLTRAPHDAGRASSPAPGDDSRGPKTRELGSPSGVTVEGEPNNVRRELGAARRITDRPGPSLTTSAPSRSPLKGPTADGEAA
jgi:hypothetical protein